MGKAVQHEADGGQGDHRFGDLREFLVVLGQPPVSAKPTERSFDHPPPGQDDETGSGDAADEDQRQAEQEAGEENREAIVDAVGEHRFEPTVQRLDPVQQGPRAVGILDVGGVDDDAQQEAGRIDRDVAFAAPDLLGRIVATRSPFSVVLTLWVSMMAAVGLGSRPSCSRSIVTKQWRMLSQTPAARKRVLTCDR